MAGQLAKGQWAGCCNSGLTRRATRVTLRRMVCVIMLNRKVSKGIILAAGDGDRLGSLTRTHPKTLLLVNGIPLISYPIKALAAAQVRDIAVVVGYLGDMVADELGNGSSFGVRFEYITNPDYLGGNAISTYKAMEWAQGEPVVLCMGDHIIEAEMVRHLPPLVVQVITSLS